MNTTIRALLDVTMSYFSDTSLPMDSSSYNAVSNAIESYLEKQINYNQLVSRVKEFTSNLQPVERLQGILLTGPDPIPAPSDDDMSRSKCRRKSRPWSSYEDQRLLCAIYNCGIENWTQISKFVGNGRTRSQCSQRWYRGLDPKINKNQWTKEEEAKLIQVVQTYGDKSWTSIASKMGNRSDVQCRYRYRQLKRDLESAKVGTSPEEMHSNNVQMGGPISQFGSQVHQMEPMQMQAQNYQVNQGYPQIYSMPQGQMQQVPAMIQNQQIQQMRPIQSIQQQQINQQPMHHLQQQISHINPSPSMGQALHFHQIQQKQGFQMHNNTVGNSYNQPAQISHSSSLVSSQISFNQQQRDNNVVHHPFIQHPVQDLHQKNNKVAKTNVVKNETNQTSTDHLATPVIVNNHSKPNLHVHQILPESDASKHKEIETITTHSFNSVPHSNISENNSSSHIKTIDEITEHHDHLAQSYQPIPLHYQIPPQSPVVMFGVPSPMPVTSPRYINQEMKNEVFTVDSMENPKIHSIKAPSFDGKMYSVY